MNFAALPERLAHVRAEIARRQAGTGWTDPVTLVAVTKGFGLDAVAAALAAGLAELGENRVQEALAKIDTPVGRRATWHLIGHLQRNKAKFVPGRFALVESLDSVPLADELARRAAAAGAPQRVLLQVNVAGESQKSGCAPDAAGALARHVAGLPDLALAGLMTIAPFTDDVAVQRRTFRGLRTLRDRLQQEEGLWLPTLSMGMSADYGVAVEEGATVIRLGTALFGPRVTEPGRGAEPTQRAGTREGEGAGEGAGPAAGTT
jgi:PLP dependent protein